MERKLLAILVAALAALLAALALRRARGDEAAAPTPIAQSPRLPPALPTAVAQVEGPTRAEPESIPVAAPSSERAREAVDAQVVPVASSARAASRAGHLVVRPIDLDTGRPVTTFTVRAASETRFADESHRGAGEELDLTLTPATYSVLVTAPGYESVELPPVRVESGGRVVLDGVPLVPGNGRILVEVFGLPPGEAVSVRLTGSGRRPCDACSKDTGVSPWQRSSACATCGYAAGCTTKRVDERGLVSFDGLSHARFALQPVDGGGRALGDSCELELAPGDTAGVELDASQSRALEIEVLDVDGTSMAPEWSERVARVAAEDDATSDDEPVIIGLGQAGASTAFALQFRRAERLVARGEFRSPTGLASAFASRRAGTAWTRHGTHDRARQPSDRLWPELPAPELPLVCVSGTVDERGIAVLRPLSTSELTLHATAEHFESATLVPASRGTTRVRLQMLRRADADPASAASLRAHESRASR